MKGRTEIELLLLRPSESTASKYKPYIIIDLALAVSCKMIANSKVPN